MRERERKRLNVSVKNKQKKSKWPSVKGKDHRFSLLLVRGFWRNKPSVLSICLGKLLRKRGFKKITEGRKLILAPRSCSQNISGWRKRKESRVRSTYRRLEKWNIGQAKNKKKVTRYSWYKQFLCENAMVSRSDVDDELFLVYALQYFDRPRFSFWREIRKARILFTI